MDVRVYKLASPVAAALPGGGQAMLRPLTITEEQRAEDAASVLPGAARMWRWMAERVSRASAPSLSVGWLLGLSIPELLSLALAQATAQRHAMAPLTELREWLRKSVCDIPEVMEDGIAAFQAERLADYYGQPLIELTPAQVAWWTLLRSAFEEMHVGLPDPVTGKLRRKELRPWYLRKDYERRVQWQIDL